MKTKTRFSHSSLLTFSLASLLLVLGGCAAPVSHQEMVPLSLQVTKHHPQSLAIVVGGGSETSATGKSQIADADLRLALVDAVNQTKTFSRVVQGKDGDYLLNVDIFNLTQPSFGFSFTVKLEMGWSLTKVSTGAVVWKEAITSEHTASATDAFAGVTRLKMATEGAARNNVALGLAKLSALSL